MQYRTLPGTEIRVSAISMGCWAIAGDAVWGEQDEADALDAVHAAFDHGINSFDTAEMYGEGRSEQLLGKALGARRGEAIIASKVWPNHMSPEQLMRSFETSLRHLGTDYIDLYQLHWPPRDVPLEDAWAVLEKLKRQGKVRAIGVSNFGWRDLQDLLSFGRPTFDQLPYNLLARAIEYEVQPMCVAEGIGVFCYSPLMQGLLAGKYAVADDVPPGRARTRHFSRGRPQARHGEAGHEASTFAAINAVRAIARRIGLPMDQVSLAWLLRREAVVSVIAGARSRSQIERNAAAASLTLDDAVMKELDDATAGLKRAMGRNCDLWQGEAQSRYR